MSLADRERQLLALVETYQAEECRRLLEAAQGAARVLVQGAYRGARQRLHQRTAAERTRARRRIEAAQAELATRERRATERLHWQLLEVAWPRLREVLLGRWQSPEGRRVWVEWTVRDALESLPLHQWLIEHAPELGAQEQGRLRAALTPRLAEPPGFASDGGLLAGVRIRCGEAVLDGTLAGLLVDRPRLEARLLGLFAQGGA